MPPSPGDGGHWEKLPAAPGGSLPRNHSSHPRRLVPRHARPSPTLALPKHRGGEARTALAGRHRADSTSLTARTAFPGGDLVGTRDSPQATSHREHGRARCGSSPAPGQPGGWRATEERLTLILRDFFSSLMTVSLSSSFSPSPSASVISARRAAARRSAGGVGCNQRNKTQNRYF